MEEGKVRAEVFALGKREEKLLDLSIKNNNTSNIIIFQGDLMYLAILINDFVELESFLGLLEGKEKKIILDCKLLKEASIYEGRRKLTRKDGILAVSLGGMRLEFGVDSIDTLRTSLRSIKQRISG
jgi:hypothetical protein